MSTFSPVTIDSSLLLNYYSAQLSSIASTATPSTTSTSSGSNSAGTSSFGNATTNSTSSQTPPWDQQNTLSAQQQAAQILATTNFIQTSTTPLVGSSGASAETQADNQKLFTLYQAVSQLATLAGMAQQSGLTSGQLAGYNTRFQEGMQQVESYIGSTTFNNLTLQTQTPSASVTAKASVPFPAIGYTGSTIVSDADLGNALPGVSTGDSFTIGVTKGGTTTNVNIDLSQIQGPLTLDNIVNYANQQLAADGFSSRLQRTMTSGSITDVTKASYGITINSAPGETLDLSSDAATPALYLAGTTGSTTGTPANATTGQAATSADNQGRLTKLTDLSTSPQSVFSTSESPSSGTTTAQSTVVDSQGNVYVLGNATGNFGSELNQGTQDVYLSKYDSAGNLQWTKLVGSASSASGYAMALNPQGGVVVAGSTTAQVTSSAVSDGNSESFVAAYDTNGNQTWAQQIPTLNTNQANAVTVDSQGNVYVGGQVEGSIGAGQSGAGGTNAYVAQLNSSGQIVGENEFGPSGNDQVSAMATTSDGGVVVATVQNGEAYLSKYSGGAITGTPVWQMDLGNLDGGTISGLAVSGDQVYVSGTTSNTQLDADGQATIASPSNGNTNAFVLSATDNGTSVTAGNVSYVGTSTGATSGGSLTVGADGTVYLAGTTTGTFSGQSRNVQGVNNAFVAALSTSGTIDWTRQFGGSDGQSTGTSVAVDPTGSSVLDALGLPTGTINPNPSLALTSQTTLQAGDSFSLQVEGTAGHTSTITISQGETLQSLADSINSELLSAGKASVTYANGGDTLEITANAGYTIALKSGPANSDALGRLGITPGVITAPAKKGSTSSTSANTSSTTSFGIPASSSNASSSTAKPVFGLGLNTAIDLLSGGDAGVAKISLQNVMTAITNAYQATNTTATSSTSAASTQSSGPAPAYLQSQVANYSLALQAFSLTNSLSSSSSSSGSSSISSSLMQSLLTA